MLTIDTTCTVAICARTVFVCLLLLGITHSDANQMFVDPTGVSTSGILDLTAAVYASTSWPSTVITIATALSAFWEQIFLLHRYWMLSRSTSWIFIFLAPVSLAQVAVAITSTVENILGRNFGQLGALCVCNLYIVCLTNGKPG